MGPCDQPSSARLRANHPNRGAHAADRARGRFRSESHACAARIRGAASARGWRPRLWHWESEHGPAPKGPNFSKIEATNDGLKFTNTGVNAEGQPTANEWSGKFDGK